jgi:hypothetical protein
MIYSTPLHSIENFQSKQISFLGALVAKMALWAACPSVCCLSVCPHVSVVRLPWNFILVTFTKICPETSNLGNWTKILGTLCEDVSMFYCFWWHKFTVKAMLCKAQYFYIGDSDRFQMQQRWQRSAKMFHVHCPPCYTAIKVWWEVTRKISVIYNFSETNMYLDSPFKALSHIKIPLNKCDSALARQGRKTCLAVLGIMPASCWAEGQWVYIPTKSNQSKVLLIHRVVQLDACKKLEQRISLLCETQTEHHHCLH